MLFIQLLMIVCLITIMMLGSMYFAYRYLIYTIHQDEKKRKITSNSKIKKTPKTRWIDRLTGKWAATQKPPLDNLSSKEIANVAKNVYGTSHNNKYVNDGISSINIYLVQASRYHQS